MRDRYGDDRRTEIIEGESGELNVEDLIAEEDMAITVTNTGSRFFPGFVSAGASGARVELQQGSKISGGEVNIASGATVEADGGGTSTISGAIRP